MGIISLIELRVAADEHISARVALNGHARFRRGTAGIEFDPGQGLGLLQVGIDPLRGTALLDVVEQIAEPLDDCPLEGRREFGQGGTVIENDPKWGLSLHSALATPRLRALAGPQRISRLATPAAHAHRFSCRDH